MIKLFEEFINEKNTYIVKNPIFMKKKELDSYAKELQRVLVGKKVKFPNTIGNYKDSLINNKYYNISNVFLVDGEFGRDIEIWFDKYKPNSPDLIIAWEEMFGDEYEDEIPLEIK